MPTTVTAPPTDLLRISDLDRCRSSRRCSTSPLLMKQDAAPPRLRPRARGRDVALFFEKPSTRTRVSFAAAAERLGMAPLVLRPDDLQLGRGEPVADTARALSGYTAAIVVRTFSHALVEEIAAAATVPVINALTDEHHPCQALADLLTIRERLGTLEGIRVAFVGSGTNVANSLVEAGALSGLEVDRRLAGRLRAVRARRRRSWTTRARPCPAPTSSTRTSGSRWARRPSRSSACAR